jgi:hypothetical protein
VDAGSENAPFQVFAGDASGTFKPDTMWPDLNGSTSGVVRAYGALQGDAFIVYPMGILGSVTLAVRTKKMSFSVIDPISGITKACHTKEAGDQFVLTDAEALLLKGVTWCGDAPCSAYSCTEGAVADGCPEAPAAPTYTIDDCLVSPTNDGEVCDDEGIEVKADTKYVLACMGDQGGKVYVASNTGPPLIEDNIPRCQGWEQNGQNAWDHLEYLVSIVCDGSQEVLELDLSNWAGFKVYVGVHDHPVVGAGHDTTACIAKNKKPGSGEGVKPPDPQDPECESEFTNEESASVKATAVYVKKNYPEFFNIDHLDPLPKRIKAYEMMTLAINHLRAKGVNASRCVANKDFQQDDPFYWCSDALVIGDPGNGTHVDLYQDWSEPANPQAYVTEECGQTGVVTDDLVPLP